MVDKYVCMDNGFAFSILDQVNGIILFQFSDHQINQSSFSKEKKKKTLHAKLMLPSCKL